MYLNNLGHLTKMAAMPIYGKNPSKIFFPKSLLQNWFIHFNKTWFQASMTQVLQCVYGINHDPVITLTYFREMSTRVAYAFEWVKLLKCHSKGKTCGKLANGQDIDYSEEEKMAQGFICLFTGAIFLNIQTCLLVYTADLR